MGSDKGGVTGRYMFPHGPYAAQARPTPLFLGALDCPFTALTT